jgi:hypothetical protein
MSAGQPPEPTELIYLPKPSWLPAIMALGLTLVVVGLFSLWVYGVIGAVIALIALWNWIGQARRDVARLPGKQRAATAVLPAVPLRRRPRT